MPCMFNVTEGSLTTKSSKFSLKTGMSFLNHVMRHDHPHASGLYLPKTDYTLGKLM